MANHELVEARRAQFREVYDSILATQKQFSGWFQQAKKVRPRNKDMWQLINEIHIDEWCYQRCVSDLPKVEHFTPDEIENRTGAVSRLCEIGEEIIRLGTTLEMKLSRLRGFKGSR